MPHAIVKMNAGRTEAQKRACAEAVTEAIRTSLGLDLDAISVAIEDVPKEAWMSAVYEPDILGKPETIFKQPGYGRG